MSELSGSTLAEVAAAVASAEPLPAGGSSAAVAGSLAAALVELCAGVAAQHAEAGQTGTELRQVAERAAALRGKLLELAERDVAAGAAGLAREASEGLPAAESVDVPLAIAAGSAEAATAAAELADSVPGHARADAVAAVLLGEAATAAAARIVAVNLAPVPDDPRVGRAAELARSAAAARTRVA